MTLSYSPTNVFKQCATCESWGGPRELRDGYFRKSAEVGGDGSGACRDPESVFFDHLQPAAAGCSRWVKWRVFG